MPELSSMDRRHFLRISAAAVAGSATVTWIGAAPAAAAPAPAFVDDYTTNVLANLTPETNAVVRILAGLQRLWKTGATWDAGLPLAPDVLHASMRHVIAVTRARTDAQARTAFIFDRQHQSYAVIAGLGPLADAYKAGAKAVTGITAAPDGTPPTTVSDTLPADAPAGSAIGAGSTTSELGLVVQLVNALRGPFASSNPGKYAYQYPRPWRMTGDSQVVDTGAVDALGYPVYRSDVVVAPQLLRQRGTSPTDDGGFPSGHTNAFYLAALALAYAVPERFQELLTRAAELSDTRIVAGMHSPVDVIGGRIMGTALAAAALSDPANAQLKAAARRQAAEYLQAHIGTGADPYADREANRRAVTARLTYGLPGCGGPAGMVVPKGAEVLLETRLPYLDAGQRREVLRTTALRSGAPLLDGPEQWGRLNLFAAADGYGAFDADVRVTMDTADAWRNDIGGRGGLVKAGPGALTLTGANRFAGGTRLEAGTLTAASATALGTGDVEVLGGTLELATGVRVGGAYRQSAGVLKGAGLTVEGTATLEPGSVLELEPGARTVQVLRARRLRGRFGTIVADGCTVVPVYTRTGLSVQLIKG